VQSAAYSQTLQSTGGVTPYTWSLTAGSLPTGLSLNATIGVLSGTPTATGVFNFTVQVQDSYTPQQTDTQALSITVNPQLDITTASLPNGVQNTAYSQTLSATGGTLPYTWSRTAGNLPTGLTLNPTTGLISGTPTATGVFSFTFQAQDSGSPQQTDTQSLSIIAGIFIDNSGEGVAKSPDGNTEINFDPGDLGKNGYVIIDPNPIGVIPPDPTGYYRIGDSIVKIEIYDSSGNPITSFNNPTTLILCYPDTNPDDGIVDDITPPLNETSLKIYTLKGGIWEEVPGSIVDPVANTVSVPLTHFSIYILMGQPAAASDLNDVRVYPNPFKPYDGTPETGKPYDGSLHSGIIFDNLTEGATIKIFNLAGELVYEESGITGKVQWNAKNEKGKEVASGVYIYLVTDKDGRKATGKVVIVR